MAENEPRPIIIKKKKVIAGGGHHGGAWKVAYADFVTAMMAFFMLMWLLNATTEKQRKGLADYFSPTIPINRVSGGGVDIFSGDSVHSDNSLAKNGKGSSGQDESEKSFIPSPVGGASPGESAGEASDEMDATKQKVDEVLFALAGESNLAREAAKHIVTRVTDEGLVVEIFDLPGRPLFDREVPDQIVTVLAKMIVEVSRLVSNPLSVGAHVAAQPLVVSNYDVWNISAARAATFRDLMLAAGHDRTRIKRTVGYADRTPTDVNPLAARNNRLELIYLRTPT